MTKKTKINRSDLKIFPSERLTDNDDGGGLAMGTPITGVANELFNPISSVARVMGNFALRLIYTGLQRADSEKLIGAFVALTRPPKDDSVSYLLFKASKFGELRKEILKRIEAYSVPTIESRMTLLSTQASNSKVVQAYQSIGESLPLVGDRYCLIQNKKGYAEVSQYVQISKVTSEDRTFTNPQTGKDFSRTVVKMEITQPLDHDFIGVDYPSESYADTPCKICETHVADAGAYYGVKPIVQAIKANTQKVQVSSIMEKIIPTSQIETALVDLTATGTAQGLFDAGKTGEYITLNVNLSHRDMTNVYVGNAIMPNTLTITTSSGEITDKGGTLYQNDMAVGVVNYAHALVTVTATTSMVLNSVRFRPASSENKIADTLGISVTQNNRGYTYTVNLNPAPLVGTLTVSYRSQGRWYELKDDGSGALRGSSQAYGSGNVNFATGSVTISCGELPDVGSAIIYAWGTQANYFNRANSQAVAKLLLQLTQDSDPSNLTLTWQNNGEKTARLNNGQLTGDLTGTFDSVNKRLLIDMPSDLPMGGVAVKASYTVRNGGEKTYQSHKAPLRDGQGKITLDLGDKAIAPNTVRLRWNLLIEDYNPVVMGAVYTKKVDPYKTVRDDGNGKLVDENGKQVGTIDYMARRLTFTPDTTVKIPKTKYSETKIGSKVIGKTTETLTGGMGATVSIQKDVVQDIVRMSFTGFEYIDAGASMPIDETGLAEVWFYDTTSSNVVSENLTLGDVLVQLLPAYSERVVNGSVNFTFGGRGYFDNNGLLASNLNPATGAFDKVGVVDYANATATIKAGYWSGGGNVLLNSLVTSLDGNPVDAVTFRTPSSPIRPSSLSIQATAVDGTQLTATADSKGVLSAEYVHGVVDVEYGLVDVQFGKVVDGTWQSKPVYADTIRYNAVAYSYLPVDSDVVKIDTVRLPQDGRVPIYRRGDMLLISNTVNENIGSAFTGNQTVQLSRADVDRICVQDSNGKAVNAELWQYDLKAGSVTFAQNLDLSGYQMPLIVKHTQEERNRVLEVDIDGTLSLTFATKRDYPVADTFVSSVVIGDNDLAVRATVPFTQRNWVNVWQDTPSGEQLLNKLNVKDYPIVLTDDGAITERWVIIWKSSSQFELYGETLGFVLKTDTLQDLAPINPATNKPYFIIPKQAFGNDAPWAVQDVIRFNTEGTLLPVWVICAVQPTANPLNEEDGFTVCLFGDTTEV